MKIVLWLFAITLFVSLAFSQDAATQIQSKIVPLFQEARQAEQRREFAPALKLYDLILQLDSNLAEVWTNRGLVLYELNRHREALAAFRRSSELKPQLLTPLVFQGIEYLKLNEPRKAVKPLQSALNIEPHHSQASYELANAYARLEQFDQAIKVYHDLLQRDPQMEQARYRLGIAYLNWSKAAARKLLDSREPSPYGKTLLGQLQAVGGLFQDAEFNLKAAVAALPNSVQTRLALGSFYLDFQASPQRILAAQEQIEKAKELDPQDPQVEIALIRLALVKQDFSEALSRLTKVLLADPSFSRKSLPELALGLPPDRLRKILTALGTFELASRKNQGLMNAARQAILYSAHLELQEVEHAEENLHNFEELMENLAAKPGNLDLRSYTTRLKQLEQEQLARRLSVSESLDLTISAWHVGEYGRGLQTLQFVLESTRDPRALYWLSLTCRALARQTFQEAINKNPDSYRAHLLVADLANDSRDTIRALAEYEKAVSLGAADPEVHLLYIQFLTSRERDVEALERARVAVEKFPSHPALNCELGKLVLKSSQPQKAVAYFRRALEADPLFTSAHAGLADSYAAADEFDKAIQEMKQALTADNDGSFHYRMARWYQKLGRMHESDEAFAISTRLKAKKREQERTKLLMNSTTDQH